jgi:hypothetical protein
LELQSPTTGRQAETIQSRKGKFYLVWTEQGKKREQRVKGNFEAAVKAARAKERHLEDAADGFERPDPLKRRLNESRLQMPSKLGCIASRSHLNRTH